MHTRVYVSHIAFATARRDVSFSCLQKNSIPEDLMYNLINLQMILQSSNNLKHFLEDFIFENFVITTANERRVFI